MSQLDQILDELKALRREVAALKVSAPTGDELGRQLTNEVMARKAAQDILVRIHGRQPSGRR